MRRKAIYWLGVPLALCLTTAAFAESSQNVCEPLPDPDEGLQGELSGETVLLVVVITMPTMHACPCAKVCELELPVIRPEPRPERRSGPARPSPPRHEEPLQEAVPYRTIPSGILPAPRPGYVLYFERCKRC